MKAKLWMVTGTLVGGGRGQMVNGKNLVLCIGWVTTILCTRGKLIGKGGLVRV